MVLSQCDSPFVTKYYGSYLKVSFFFLFSLLLLFKEVKWWKVGYKKKGNFIVYIIICLMENYDDLKKKKIKIYYYDFVLKLRNFKIKSWGLI